MFLSLKAALIVSLLSGGHACNRLELHSDVLGPMTFSALTADKQIPESSGRISFESNGEKKLYLYHTLVNPVEEGVGRWYVQKINMLCL